MTAAGKNMKHETIFFTSQDHFTSCMAGIMLLKTYVDFFKNSGFVPGFFEGKPRGKKQTNAHLS
jgi:hypothetical protein